MEPQVKRDEEYPLLKVDTEGGDGKIRNTVPATVTTTEWNITCTPKQTWCSRWPEFVSAFWMTLILLAISFLVFYAVGMSAYGRQPIVIVRCNDTGTKPGSDVFYHHIIPRGDYVPFTIFSEYLSFMATQYPTLRFNVYFLIDDSWQSSLQRSKYSNPRLLKRLVPYVADPFNMIFNQYYKKDVRVFQRRYQNVNISVLYLSKYMALTPLRYKWKMIPQNYLSFYARIFEIWHNGGMGFDLVTFNNLFNNNKQLDRRVDAILKQHDSGFESEKYDDLLYSLDNDEQNDLFSMFFNFIDHVVYETRLLFNSDLPTNDTVLGNNPIIRTHRNKRYINSSVFNDTNTNGTLSNNNTSIKFNENAESVVVKQNNYSSLSEQLINGSSLNSILDLITNDIKMPNMSDYRHDMPQAMFFYDISGYSDDTGSTHFLSKPIRNSAVASRTATASNQKSSNYLSLSPDGQFVAASSRHHPFLAQLLSSSCHRINPKYAIKDTLLSQCSGFLRNDVYCESIRVIYNIV